MVKERGVGVSGGTGDGERGGGGFREVQEVMVSEGDGEGGMGFREVQVMVSEGVGVLGGTGDGE